MQTEGVIERRGYEEFTGLISEQLISKTLEFFNKKTNEENNNNNNNVDKNSSNGTTENNNNNNNTPTKERSHKHKNEEDPAETLEKVSDYLLYLHKLEFLPHLVLCLVDPSH